jgi:hypothetical protein
VNGFFEDLEDGLEPIEADDDDWIAFRHGWRDPEQEKVSEVPGGQTEQPDLETLIEWFTEDAGCEATDGCWVEPDGTCQHGHQSWFLVLGLI